ncbi:MAG: putative metalloprotease CJM1_0395 family protein [Alphaproteobacteria bacterium]
MFSAQEEQTRDGEKVGEDGLTDSERREVERLKARDREVRDHEQAHVAAGGPYVSAPSFRFVRGPDGQFYAVGGEVQIDATPVPGNPQATIRKMEVVKRAALAPQQPSAQDRRVAAQAEAQAMRARRQITEMERDEAAAAAERREAQLAEQTGQRRTLPAPGSEPAFDPEARFRHATGGIGAPPGTGLAGAGNLKTEIAGTLDAGALFNLVA